MRSKNGGRKIVSESKVLKFFAPHFSTDSFSTFVRMKMHRTDTAFFRVAERTGRIPMPSYSGKEKTCPSFLEAINRKIAMSMLVAMN